VLVPTDDGVGATVEKLSAEPPQATRAAAQAASMISVDRPRTGHVYQKRHHDRIYLPVPVDGCSAVS
jgi:hypothetical protein